MKKITLFVMALALVGMTNAKEFATISKEKVNYGLTAKQIVADEAKAESVSATDVVSEFRARRAAQATYAYADWSFAAGQMHYGFGEGAAGYPIAAIILPYQREITWNNSYGATDWTIDDELVAENSETAVFESRGLVGAYSGLLPVTAPHKFVASSGTEYDIWGSSYGLDESNRWLAQAPDELYINGTDNLIMTLCAMHTDTMNGGSDMYRISNSNTAYGKYFNGTGRILDLTKPDVTADTIGIIVDNNAVMKIDQILLTIYKEGAEKVQDMIPDGAELRVALFPLYGNQIDFSDTIASTVVTNASFVDAGVDWIGTLGVKFYDVDLQGQLAETPIWTPGSFYLQITNFNETGCDFGFFSDYYCPETYTTVYQQDNKFKFLSGGGANLAIMFDGYYPTFVNDTTINELNAPVEGGIAYFGDNAEDNEVLIYTNNLDPEAWEIEADEWIEITVDDQYLERYNAAFLQFTCEALPEGEEYREGTVYFFVDGAELEITIIQGEKSPEAIEDVTFRNDGKTYNVLGMEVGEDYKGIVIRNGEKFVR